MVTKFTRNATLDKIYTSLAKLYKIPEILPAIGASNHNIVLYKPVDTPTYRKGEVISKMVRKYDKNAKTFFSGAIQDIK